MKKSAWVLGLGIIAVLAIGSGAVRTFGPKAPVVQVATTTVQKRDLALTIVENGTIAPIQSVEVKGRVTGRLAKLWVDVGDTVRQGDRIAEIDPLETELRRQQDAAQLKAAQSAAARTSVELQQRRETTRAAYQQAVSRLREVERERETQPSLSRAAINEAQATLQSAMRDRDRLVQSSIPTQRVSAQTGVDEARTNLRLAESELARQAELEQKGYASRRAVESAQNALDLARARLTSAQEQQGRLGAQHESERARADAAVRQAEATVARARANQRLDVNQNEALASARAEVVKARAAMLDVEALVQTQRQNQATVEQLTSVLSDSTRQLSETLVRAPMTGTVVRKGLEVGELATGLSTFGSGTTIVKIEDRRAMLVKLNVNEIDVAKMTLGMKALVNVDALPDRTFSGTVVKIAPASVASTAEVAGQATPSTDSVVRYAVEIRLDAATPEVKTGMSAKCSLDVLKRTSTLVVPVDYILRENARDYVLYRSPNARPGAAPERRAVQLGARSGAFVEVLDGVSEGDVLEKPEYQGPERKSMIQFGGDEE
jgi:HlyD family secretion protein